MTERKKGMRHFDKKVRSLALEPGYADHLEKSLIEGTDYDTMDDSFYSADEELGYEGPVTHSRTKAWAKVNTLMNEHFNAYHNETHRLWLLELLWLIRGMWN